MKYTAAAILADCLFVLVFRLTGPLSVRLLTGLALVNLVLFLVLEVLFFVRLRRRTGDDRGDALVFVVNHFFLLTALFLFAVGNAMIYRNLQ